jgi:hypothetical protein
MTRVLIYSPSFAWRPGSSPSQVVAALCPAVPATHSVPAHVTSSLSRLSSGTAKRTSGCARRCTVVLRFGSPPFGSWFLPLRGHPPRKRALALGSSHPSRPSRLSAPSRSGERNGGFNRMYQNRISLMGFTGKDAEARTTKNQTAYAVLSLATKSSYKDKKSGEYVSHTEWHRHRRMGKGRRVRQHAEEGHAPARRRRTAQPHVRRQEEQGRPASCVGSTG